MIHICLNIWLTKFLCHNSNIGIRGELEYYRIKKNLVNIDFSRNIFWWIIPPELLRQKQFKIWKSFIMPKAACLNKCCCCFRTPWRKKLQPFWQQRPLAFLLCPYILLCKAMCIFFLTGLLIWLIYSFFETIYLNLNSSFFFLSLLTDIELLSLAKHHWLLI